MRQTISLGEHQAWIVKPTDTVLVTGAAGFVGSRVVDCLLRFGFKQVRCFVRPGGECSLLESVWKQHGREHCQLVEGNLLSRLDCERAVAGATVVYHLVAGRGKSFPACFQGSVVTTRNLLDAVVQEHAIKRFVNVSSFAVYSNFRLRRGAVWDETCPLEDNLAERHSAYAYAKLKQDELVQACCQQHDLPYSILRPGIVFGPGKKMIPGFVGMDTFGFFMHLGGGYPVPLTYVDNCAEAIVLAGLIPGVEGEVFNVVDDSLPTSRAFLRQYKREVRRFCSVRVPYWVAYRLCHFWERYAVASQGQVPPVFNRRVCGFAWKGHRYSNRRLKEQLGWSCRVPMSEALRRYFDYQRDGKL